MSNRVEIHEVKCTGFESLRSHLPSIPLAYNHSTTFWAPMGLRRAALKVCHHSRTMRVACANASNIVLNVDIWVVRIDEGSCSTLISMCQLESEGFTFPGVCNCQQPIVISLMESIFGRSLLISSLALFQGIDIDVLPIASNR